MNSRLYMGAPVSPGFDAIYAAPSLREQVAALPTQHARIMAIQALRVTEQNMVCQQIIDALMADNAVHKHYKLYKEMYSIKQALHKEFFLHADLSRGWKFMFGGHQTLHLEPTALNSPYITQALNNLVVTDNNRNLWQELADWFAGKYYKFGFQNGQLQHFERNVFGNYPLIDSTDRLMYIFTGVRQLDLSIPYYTMAQIINQRIAATAAPKQCAAQLFYAKPANAAPQPSAPPLLDASENEAQYHYVAPTAPALTVSDSSEEESREEFECPVMLTQMQHAMICTLDGVSYEAEALQQSLKALGRTPTNIKVAAGDVAKVALPNTNLQAAINCYNNGEPAADYYRCEITQDVMRSAMFCTLDNRSYDANAIRDYLQTHRKTPTGAVLANNVNIDDVLVPNLALRNAIENHQRLTQTNVRSLSRSM